MFGNYLGVAGLKGRPGDEKRIKGAAPPARYTKASTSGPQDASGVRCQKCLKLGHWSYDCKNQQVYKSRPSRTQQLLKPKKAKDGPSVQVPAEFGGSGQSVTSSAPLAIESGLASKILEDKQKERRKKRARSASTSSSDSSASDSSNSSASTSTSDSSSSGSDSDSGSSSGSSSSSSSRGTRRRTKSKRRARSVSRSRSRSRSRSPVRRRRDSRSRSDSRERPARRRSPSPRRAREASKDRSASPPPRTMSIKGKAKENAERD
ncbi:hypothetical protein P389DRAFT_174214 [Cystobasidium minutum MCA 4210]|uniref:uncharacterized protein n=1 Tax=Cystobasidium minutum MCA 4210 TaxID=1397322 RepID=UPI0034CF7E4B|eukprot:jgi/Rhomi1/174214/fgenesh1_kg.7_\